MTNDLRRRSSRRGIHIDGVLIRDTAAPGETEAPIAVAADLVEYVRRSGDAVYCVDRVESRRPVRLQFDRGQAMSLHRGSMARILLASMSVRERNEHLANILPTLDPTSASLIGHEALDAVRSDGWTESYEEVDEGIWGTAAAITSRGIVIASVGTAAPIFRTDAHRRSRIITLIKEAGREISLDLERS